MLSESDGGINIRADIVTILVTLRIFVAYFCQILLQVDQTLDPTNVLGKGDLIFFKIWF